MGAIAEHLQFLISKQIEDHGVVVWYDPGSEYADVLPGLAFEGTRVVAFDGSFYQLRHEVDGLLNGEEPPRLLVYVPLDPSESHHALAELEAMGVVMRPGQQPPARNTRLGLVVRNALLTVLGEERAGALEKEVEQGKLGLAEVETLAERADVAKDAVLGSIFGTGDTSEMALAFLSSDEYDAAIKEKDATSELGMLLAVGLGADFQAPATTAALRRCLAQHVLATDLAAALGGRLPGPLSGVPIAQRKATKDACARLAHNWRTRRDLRESYALGAQTVDEALGLGNVDFTLVDLLHAETFRRLEGKCQEMVERELLQEARLELVEAANARQSSFWSAFLPEVQARWALIGTVGQLLIEAARVEEAMSSPPGSTEQFVRAYACGDRPLCLLDTCYRHLEQRVQRFPFGMGEEHAGLEKLIARGRERYASVAGRLAEAFIRQYEADGFLAEGVLRQQEVFPEAVRGALEEGKTAYVLVDALRYEMCRELLSGLGDDYEVSLKPALGAVPSITEVGMAALVAARDEDVTVTATSDGGLAVELGGAPIMSRTARLEHLAKHAGVPTYALHLEELLPAPSRRTRQAIADASLVAVTSQDIDSVCEKGNPALAKRMMQDLLQQLTRAFRVLSELGVQRLVIAADHGYLFLEELGADMKIDAPGGQTVSLHRRVWVGKGGASSPSLMRATLAQLEIGGELEVAVPWGFGCLKVAGGGTSYFHGGLSPEEIIIPVATVVCRPSQHAAPASDIEWTLVPGSDRVTTRFFSVHVRGKAKGLFPITAPKVHVELRSEDGVVSQAVSASYGFQEGTGDVQLRCPATDGKTLEANTVTLMLSEESGGKTVSLHLLDPATNRELARLPGLKVSLSI